MRRLTSSEREIRSSAGISLTRFWPFAAMFLADSMMSFDDQLFRQCIGHSIESSGRLAAAVRLATAIPCSPYSFYGPISEQIAFVVFWGSIPFAILQIRWMKRHRAYWDSVRAREKIRRAERRSAQVVKPTEQER